VVTEAGFGADLGAEKFFDIKCRKGGLKPAAAVIVATVRALKMHGGVPRDQLKVENLAALEKGFANLARHLENVKSFGVPPVVGINKFSADTRAEVELVIKKCAELGVACVESDHWAGGGEGARPLAEAVVAEIAKGTSDFKPLYPDDMPLLEKVRTVARTIYRAKDIVADDKVTAQLKELDADYGKFPICIAKTQYSFSSDAAQKGAPEGFTIPIREVRLSAGAEFIVIVCGDVMTMPGLPRVPAANSIKLDAAGKVTGLF